MLNAQQNDHCIAFRVLPFVSATQRMTKTRVNALTTMYERKLLAQKLKGKKNCISFHGSESYPIQISELKHKGVVWTSNTPGEHQVRRQSSYCYGEGYQPVGQCRDASAETLDANWEDLKNAEFELYIPLDISYSTCLSCSLSDSCLCK
jgi:hypothetical protein